jgi:hypothetical protein
MSLIKKSYAIESRTPLHRQKEMKSKKMFLIHVGAALLLVSAFLSPAQARDRSCHNDAYNHHRGHPYHRGSGSGLVFQFNLSPEPVYRAPSYGYSRNIVADVQNALNRRGYEVGPVDGVMGYWTRGAIRQYQADRGLYPTGTINEALLRSLRLQ